MSDETFTIKRGDTLFLLLYELDPATVDLTGATVLFNFRPRNGAMLFSRAATAPVLTGKPTVAYAWQAGDTDEAGLFEAEFEAAYPDGRRVTFPNKGFIQVIITDDIR